MPASLKKVILDASKYLEDRGLPNPRLDAEMLLAGILGRDRSFLYAHSEVELSRVQTHRFWSEIQRRGDFFPLQYLLGSQEFFGRSFEVTPAVLIPRPETEIVVSKALQILESHPDFLQIADIGTGSGCIAITLCCEKPALLTTATDISPEALVVARRNARRFNCLDRIDFRCGSLTEPLLSCRASFDLVISNPPYVGFNESDSVSPEVSRFEPAQAVFAGETGLESIRQLISEVPAILKTGGFLLLEIGYRQSVNLQEMTDQSRWELIEICPDLAGIERCAVLKLRP